jgi:hypothetical protein
MLAQPCECTDQKKFEAVVRQGRDDISVVPMRPFECVVHRDDDGQDIKERLV